MSGEDTWFELRPGSAPDEGGERYPDQAAAEQAATALLIRRPDVLYVEIAQCGEGAAPTVVGRISPSQPPAPAAAEIDDLHKLPRGAPEQ